MNNYHHQAQQHRVRHSSPGPVITSPPSECSLNFTPRTAKQPLYRPAVLRHNSSTNEIPLYCPSPPLSPAGSSSDLKGSWLAGLASAAPWSASLGFDATKLDGAIPKGTVLPRSQWKRDEDALECASDDCQIRFGLIDRKHHCRRCGNIFCASHSGHSMLLWSSAEECSTPPTPKATPKPTPRSSALDIPALIQNVSLPSRPSSPSPSISSVSSSSIPTRVVSPTKSLAVPISCRVCDSCAFLLPAAPLTLASTLALPLSLSFSNGRTHSPHNRSPLVSPGVSPPYTVAFRGKTRSRHNSTTSASSSSEPHSLSTAPSSLEALSRTSSGSLLGVSKQRGVSPATSARGGIRVVQEEESDEDTEEEEEEDEFDEDLEADEERKVEGGMRRAYENRNTPQPGGQQTVGAGGWSWQSRFATF